MKVFSQTCKGCKGILTFYAEDHGKKRKCACGTAIEISYPPKAREEARKAKAVKKAELAKLKQDEKDRLAKASAAKYAEDVRINEVQEIEITQINQKEKEPLMQPQVLTQAKTVSKPRKATLSDFLIEVAEFTIYIVFTLGLLACLSVCTVFLFQGFYVASLIALGGYVGSFAVVAAPALALFRIAHHVRLIK